MIKLIKKYSDFIFMAVIIIAFCFMLMYFGAELDNHLKSIDFVGAVR